ncbi:MAG: hypothetical protein NPMRth3_670002 [Nitrosopumilales archaeon]|nr:MAG: hypothetical protein NPMRth3_670002 [Nitrosopumilales archaeon]
MSLCTGEIIGIVAIFASGGFFFLGYLLGRKNSREQLELIVKALNIDRILDGRNKKDEELFIEDNTVKGKVTEKFSFTIKTDLIDIHSKQIITEEGKRKLTDKELQKMGKNPKYWRTSCP